MVRIAVLFHSQARDGKGPRWIAHLMADAWRAMGHDVEFVYGVKRKVAADLLVPNVDLTVLPPEYVAYFEAFERVVNRRVVDISKRSFSRLGVNPGDGYEGPVIVKTNLNAGGLPERHAFGKRWRDRRITRWIFRPDPITGFHPRIRVQSSRYPVYDRVADLPRGTLGNPWFHVERFVPERDGELYCTRSYVFAGTDEFAIRNKSTRRVVKALGIVEREEIAVPEELRAFRAEHGFDFGKFDYTIADGQLHLLDVNRTPAFQANPGSEKRHQQTATRMAQGLLEEFRIS